MLQTAQKNMITSVNNIQKVIPAMPKLISGPGRVSDDDHRNQATPMNGSNAPSVLIIISRKTSKYIYVMEDKTNSNDNYIISLTGSSLTLVNNPPVQNSSLLARSPDMLHESTNNEVDNLSILMLYILYQYSN